jgi:hypothetical protein
MHTLQRPLILAFLVATASFGPACFEPVTAPKHSSSSSSTDDGATSASAGGGGGGTGGVGPSAPRTGKFFATESAAKSCADVCAEWADLYLTTCKLPYPDADYVGEAEYGSTMLHLAACSDVPPEMSGGVYFDGMTCACDTPYITELGDVANRPSCDSICAADGLTCTDATPWWTGLDHETGGAQATYQNELGSTTQTVIPCAGGPTATIWMQNKTWTLDSYDCGCIDAQPQ